MAVTAESIGADMLRLREEQRKRRRNIKNLRLGIENLCKEQGELRRYLSGELESRFDRDALQNNIDRIDSQSENIEAVIRKEQAGIDQLGQILEFLEEKKCRFETMSRLTGTPHRES